jgi:plastocyanin
MSYEVLPPSAEILRINDIIKNPDVKLPCPGFPNVIGYVKAAASGETAWADIGDKVFWDITGDSAILKYAVYGGGCDRREYGCVITKNNQIVYDGVRIERQSCPAPTPNKMEGVIASYKIIDPGSGFIGGIATGDSVISTQWGYNGPMWKVRHTYNNGGLLALSLQSGGEGFNVGDIITVNLNPEESEGRNTTDARIQVTRVQTIYLQRAADSTPDVTAAVTVVSTDDGNKYAIDGATQAEVTATAGQTILFDLSDSSLSGHPFAIYTDSTKTTQVTVGIEEDGTNYYFTPPIAGTFSYQCGAHAEMGGTITIS